MRLRTKRSGRVVGAVLGAVALVATACGSSSAAPASASTGGTIVVGAPECAHCLGMSLLGPNLGSYKVKFQPFGTLTDLTAALASGKVQVGQIDYTGLVSFVSKGIPIVAISGEVNGGSDFVLSPKIGLAANDWAGFKSLAAKDKAAGHPLAIASEFGTVQDIELRLQLPKYGIDPNTDVDFVNVPYQGMAQALQSGSVQAAIPVQPFAASITMNGYGKHFAYPYDQAAGNLTNVVVVSQSFLASHPAEVTEIAKGMGTLVSYLKTPTGVSAWAKAVEKYDNLDAPTVNTALAQLTPELNMPFSQVQAIAATMYDQHLIASPLSAATLRAHIDYTPLSQATGQSTASLGAGQ